MSSSSHSGITLVGRPKRFVASMEAVIQKNLQTISSNQLTIYNTVKGRPHHRDSEASRELIARVDQIQVEIAGIRTELGEVKSSVHKMRHKAAKMDKKLEKIIEMLSTSTHSVSPVD